MKRFCLCGRGLFNNDSAPVSKAHWMDEDENAVKSHATAFTLTRSRYMGDFGDALDSTFYHYQPHHQQQHISWGDIFMKYISRDNDQALHEFIKKKNFFKWACFTTIMVYGVKYSVTKCTVCVQSIYRRWCSRCCLPPQRPCPSAPEEALGGWTALEELCDSHAGPL